MISATNFADNDCKQTSSNCLGRINERGFTGTKLLVAILNFLFCEAMVVYHKDRLQEYICINVTISRVKFP